MIDQKKYKHYIIDIRERLSSDQKNTNTIYNE